MAEGWARHLKAEVIEPYSAGTQPKGIDPRAAQVMAESGAPISQQQSKNVNDLLSIPFDYVVTVCDSASEACPVFPGKAKVIHRSFDDPPALAKNEKNPERALSIYRRVRDEIRAFVETLPKALDNRSA